MEYKVGDKVLVEGVVVEVDEKGICNADELTIKAKFPSLCDYKIWLAEHELFELPKAEKTYEQGLEDAWELAKKIADWSHLKRNDILGTQGSNNGVADIFGNFTPQTALAKLKAYEDAQAIKVGDVVKFKRMSEEHVVLAIAENECSTYCLDEEYKDYPVQHFGRENIKDFVKTGKHVDIAGLLEQIKGE